MRQPRGWSSPAEGGAHRLHRRALVAGWRILGLLGGLVEHVVVVVAPVPPDDAALAVPDQLALELAVAGELESEVGAAGGYHHGGRHERSSANSSSQQPATPITRPSRTRSILVHISRAPSARRSGTP